MYSLGPVGDAYHGPDGRAAVLLGQQVCVLSPVSARLVAALGDGDQDVDALTRVVVADFGEPPVGDARDATERVLAELVLLGLVSRRA